MATLIESQRSPRAPPSPIARLPPLSLPELDNLFNKTSSTAVSGVATDSTPSQPSSASASTSTSVLYKPTPVDSSQSSQPTSASALRSESPFQFGNPPSFPRYERASAAIHRPWANPTTSSERSLSSLETMDIEHDQQPHAPPPSSFAAHSHSSKDHFAEDFDYTMRRHSIAALQSSGPPHPAADPHAQGPRSPFHPSLQAVKRKISHGSIVYGGQTPVESEFPDQYRSPMDPEPPKRRGSTFDARGMAQMSLNERRDSQDSGRFVPPGPAWWDRRDSTTSVYSNASISSVGGYTSSYSNDSKQTWPPQRAPQQHLPDSLPPDTRPFSIPDARTPTATAHGPAPYPDRRMSVPDASIATGAVRNFRSRSRPPSRGANSAQTVTPPHLPQITATLVNPPDQYQDPNMTVAQQPSQVSSVTQQPGMLGAPAPKETTTTPYSRSPELRISHKLAERKRRKEMKDLFDELRDNLPADRGMKSSKWEILSKAIDYIGQLRIQQHDMAREIEGLKAELDAVRGGGPPPPSNHHSYGAGMGYQQGYNVTPPQSRTSSHYPAAGPPPPAHAL